MFFHSFMLYFKLKSSLNSNYTKIYNMKQNPNKSDIFNKMSLLRLNAEMVNS